MAGMTKRKKRIPERTWWRGKKPKNITPEQKEAAKQNWLMDQEYRKMMQQ